MRTFRVERVIGIEELPTRFEHDETFDLEAYWRDSNVTVRRSFEEYGALLHVAVEALEWVTPFGDSAVVAEDERGKTLRMRFPSLQAAVCQIAGWGRAARVLEPAELQQALRERAHELLALYEVHA